jgi:hypothetical protein
MGIYIVECIHLAPVAAASAERVNDLVSEHVVVPSAARSPPPPPADGHGGVREVLEVVVLGGEMV